jgi:hypothetical protein
MKRRHKMLIQKLMGLTLIGFCLVILFTNISYDPITQCKDGTPILVLAPMGLWLLLTREVVITL